LRQAHDVRVAGATDANLSAISEIDSGVENHLITRLHAAVDLHLLPEIAYDRHLAQMHHTVLEHGDLQPPALKMTGSADMLKLGVLRGMCNSIVQ
jgi:hypothetical protein